MTTTLITHSGPFHADELLSFVLLSDLLGDTKLVRTRDEAIIGSAGEDAIVFDVGGIYDAAARRYDHHQRGRAERAPGQPYSSFGLVWLHHGRDYLRQVVGVPEDHLEDVWAAIDESFVSVIDAADNGTIEGNNHPALHHMSLSTILEDLREDFDDDADGAETAAFLDAAVVARAVLRSRARRTAATRRARSIVEDAIANRARPELLELPRGMNYLPHVLGAGADDILYAIAPKGGEWQVTAVNKALDTYDLRKPFPKDWSGKRNGDLARVTDVPDAVFCHLNLFIAVAKSREGAMRLADLALAQQD